MATLDWRPPLDHPQVQVGPSSAMIFFSGSAPRHEHMLTISAPPEGMFGQIPALGIKQSFALT